MVPVDGPGVNHHLMRAGLTLACPSPAGGTAQRPPSGSRQPGEPSRQQLAGIRKLKMNRKKRVLSIIIAVVLIILLVTGTMNFSDIEQRWEMIMRKLRR
jgi:hypothetical protein